MPKTSTLYTDARLTGIAVESSRQNSFVADEIAPPLDSRKQSDQIPVIDPKRDKQRILNDVVPKGGAASVVDVELGDPLTFFCKKHQLKGIVADEDVANVNDDVRSVLDKTTELRDRIRLIKENNLSAMLLANLTTGNGRAESISDADKKWDNDLSDPLEAMAKKISEIEIKTGITVNRIAMGAKVLRTLGFHPAIRGTSQYVLPPDQQIGGLTNIANRIAGLLGVEKVVFSLVTKNLAAMGATASMSQMWGANVLLYYHEPPSTSRTNAGLAVTPKWTTGERVGNVGGYMNGMRVQRWREDDRDGEWIKVTEFYDQMLLNGDAGFLFKDVLTT